MGFSKAAAFFSPIFASQTAFPGCAALFSRAMDGGAAAAAWSPRHPPPAAHASCGAGWSSLSNISLTSTSLSGSLPSEYADLTALRRLELGATKLGGMLPTSIDPVLAGLDAGGCDLGTALFACDQARLDATVASLTHHVSTNFVNRKQRKGIVELVDSWGIQRKFFDHQAR